MPELDSFTTMLANEIVPVIKEWGGIATPRDIRRRIWTYRTTDGWCVLHSLVNHGFGRWMNKPTGPKGGRPTVVFVLNGVDLPGATAADPQPTYDPDPGEGESAQKNDQSQSSTSE